MFRTDGEYVFYRIEEYQSKWDRWVAISSFYLKEYEFGEHTFCGECWQKLGVTGIFDLDYAKEYCNKLNDYILNSDFSKDNIAEVTKFRIVKVTILQKQEVLIPNNY